MTRTLYLVPSGHEVGLTSIALGLVRALDKRGTRVAFYKPIGQAAAEDAGPERSTYFVRHTSSIEPAEPIALDEAEGLMAAGRSDELLERVMRGYHASSTGADVVVVEGLVDSQESSGESELNRELVRTLSAEVILAAALGDLPLAELEVRLERAASRYGGFSPGHVIGTILNRVRTEGPSRPSLYGSVGTPARSLDPVRFDVLGVIPENPELLACRTVDIARHLHADIIHEGEIMERRVRRISLLARTIPNLLDEVSAGTLLVT
ncbi:MAG TPA: AAA family ATPase, partial [Polyangiaceae bacterium]|nr:AAA family ATPase [Polyangiaceae bacterium]